MKLKMMFKCLLLLVTATVAHAAPPVIKLATLAPKGTTYHQELLAMGEKWAAAPGGGAKLVVYTDGSLGGEAEMVRRLRAGQIQAAMLTVTGLSYIDESVAALQNMPMVFRSTEELEHVREQLRPMLEEKFRKQGFVFLFWGDAGWVRFFSRRPATTPEDFQKMRMFTWAGYSKATDLWKTAGFQPVELEVTDILTGLNTGMIDAVPSEPYYALAGQFSGPAPHMLDLKWAPLVGGAVMTEKAFNALPAETRKALTEASAATGQRLTAESRRQSEEAINIMKSRHGLKVTPVSPEIEARWRQMCEAFYPKIRGSIVPTDMYDRVRTLLDEYRKANPAQGQ